MSRALNERWVDNAYNGVVTAMGPVPVSPHDPDVRLWGATLSRSGPRSETDQIGGAGWTTEAARLACTGEAIERLQPYPLPSDGLVRGSYAELRGRTRLSPAQLRQFHPDQFTAANPFEAFSEESVCDWAVCRDLRSGEPVLAPAETIYLYPPGNVHRFGPGISTGLSCGRRSQPVALAGLREVLERDAVVGAWWGAYELEELADNPLRHDAQLIARVSRPNLSYRFYRVRSPHTDMVTLVSLSGEDLDGPLFSIGSACRESLAQSFEKSLLEAIQGRHFVRYLAKAGAQHSPDGAPHNFVQHATYYSQHPARLRDTVLENATRAPARHALPRGTEDRRALLERLGERRVIARLMTPPAVGQVGADWQVVRVWVEGMQALHGDHGLPFLGGPLWRRPIADWRLVPPHPFA